MCGRYTVRSNLKRLGDLFGVNAPPDLFSPRYNVAPSQQVPAVRTMDASREVVSLKWGLLPRFFADPSKCAKPINARGETVAKQPMFRSAFQSRRCLMLADGFYEWEKLRARTKRPWFFRLKDDEPFAFAGLWESWGEGENAVETCALITTSANELVGTVHDRIPVIVPVERFD